MLIPLLCSRPCRAGYGKKSVVWLSKASRGNLGMNAAFSSCSGTHSLNSRIRPFRSRVLSSRVYCSDSCFSREPRRLDRPEHAASRLRSECTPGFSYSWNLLAEHNPTGCSTRSQRLSARPFPSPATAAEGANKRCDPAAQYGHQNLSITRLR